MARGRHYYDPIIQAPATVESAASRRIELFPEGDVTDSGGGAERLRWVGRLVDEEGRIIDTARGSFDHDDALRQAQELWPGLEVFELREESEDSTWEGMGPSPRLWRTTSEAFVTHRIEAAPLVSVDEVPPAGDPPRLLAITAAARGTYVLIEDVLACLEEYASQFDGDNPSAALGIRQAAAALREPF